MAVHGDISEHRVRVVLAVRTDQPLIRELLERFMTMLERYEITIQYGQYQLTQVPEPNLIIDPVPPRPGSSGEERKCVFDDVTVLSELADKRCQSWLYIHVCYHLVHLNHEKSVSCCFASRSSSPRQQLGELGR